MPPHEMDHSLQPAPLRKAGKREGPTPKESQAENFVKKIISYCPFKVFERKNGLENYFDRRSKLEKKKKVLML